MITGELKVQVDKIWNAFWTQAALPKRSHSASCRVVRTQHNKQGIVRTGSRKTLIISIVDSINRNVEVFRSY